VSVFPLVLKRLLRSQETEKTAIPKTSNIDKKLRTFFFMVDPFEKVIITFLHLMTDYLNICYSYLKAL